VPVPRTDAAREFAHLIGHRFPGGTVTVPRWLNRLWADSVAAVDPSPYVHPILVYYVAVEGSGVNFQDIFDLMEGSAESGIMFANQSLEFAAPIEIEHVYDAAGGIVDVVRKRGRRAGVFDLCTFQIGLTEPDGDTPAALSTSTFVFPRQAPA
jgi:hypothetical protein